MQRTVFAVKFSCPSLDMSAGLVTTSEVKSILFMHQVNHAAAKVTVLEPSLMQKATQCQCLKLGALPLANGTLMQAAPISS